MFKRLVLVLMLGSLGLLQADVIVLKNGKKMTIPGTYEVKGQYVVFTSNKGNVLQVPLTLVDLDKSAKATDAHHAAIAAKKAALNAAPKVKKDDSLSMADIAERIESKRNKDTAPPRITLKNEKLETFSSNNPRPTNDSVDVPSIETELTPDKVNQKRRQFNQSYQKLQQEIEVLDNQLQEAEAIADTFANEAAFTSDAGGSNFDAMERMDKRVADLRKLRVEKAGKMKELETQARRSGVRNFKNMRPDPNAKQ